jgi:hypothetical protein
MRVWKSAAAFAAVTVGLVAGCDSGPPFDGPTVKAFDGRLLCDGKPVTFPEGQQVTMNMTHERGNKFGVPIRSDGTFQIGWMPVGKYSIAVSRSGPTPPSNRPGANAAPQLGHAVPGRFEIKEGQTQYVIELGKGWKF